jgi:two-component system, NarL family, response regulator LiaR
MPGAPPISCFLADDHPPVLRFLGAFLAANGFLVAGSTRNGDAALAQILELKPQVATLDAHMPGLAGAEIARELTRLGSPTHVILYTGYGEQLLLLEALDAGARGFVRKEAPLEDLLEAVRRVAGGAGYVDAMLGGALFERGGSGPAGALSARQRDVLRLLAEGLSNEEIGARLQIGAETVRTHVRKAMEKLEAATRTQAVATAIRRSLIE